MDRERRHHRDRDGRKRSRSRSASPRGDDDHREGHRKRSKGSSRHRSRDRSPKGHREGKHRRDRSRSHDSRASDSSSRSSSSSSASSRSDDRRRHSSKKRHRKERKKKDKKHKKKKDKKKHKSKKKKSRRRSRSGSPSDSPPREIEMPSAPPGAHELASALASLFDAYPAMATLDGSGIPLLFIQLGRGTEYELSQMPDARLSGLLHNVFKALQIHGMEQVGGHGAWRWSNAMPSGGGRRGGCGGDELALLRLSRALLNGVGFTMDRVEGYERDQMQQRQMQMQQERLPQKPQDGNVDAQNGETSTKSAEKAVENEEDVRHRKRVERMTSQLLDRFDPKNSSASESSLANELQGICDVLLEGESVQLDGIENAKLKATLAQLFQLVGLELVEMEDEDSEEEDEEGGDMENGKNEEKVMGYALPDAGIKDSVASHLNEVLRVCRFRSSGGSQDAPKSWAANPAMQMEKGKAEEESSSDEDDGPAPLGTVAAVKASKRKRPPPMQTNATSEKIDEGGREEWMMVPGEHDFLKGIQAGGSKSTRGRTFKNEKNRGQSIAAASANNEPINPEVLEEVNAIKRAYEESRGPSLIDAHRQMQHDKKQQQAGQKEWTWNRDKNLEDGRRVDKNALHLVLGGASTELKSKFHGGHGR
mmetsp:Transcript_30201/g.63685  ORF Transcript_30201/g.63685 Transcript_30201/m.63685 type:complete len:649 (-) Transcript_30201:493-2439(-)